MAAKDFKKLYAAIFAIAAIIFGVLVSINERDLFDFTVLKFGDKFERADSIARILWVILDVCIIVVPLVELFLVLTVQNHSPFRVIRKSAEVVLLKYVAYIFIMLIYFVLLGAEWEYYENYLFKDDPMIVPLLIFIGSSIALFLAEKTFKNNLQVRIISTIAGSALAIIGLIVYFGLDGYNTLVTFGLILAIVCYGGLVAYFFLPQTKEE